MNSSIDLTDDEFTAISSLVYEKAGINLHAGKKELVRARLAGIIRSENFGTFGNFFKHTIRDETGNELVRLLDAVSTNLTHFFREPEHFSFMAGTFLPEILSSKTNGRPRSLRIWSAGCSTGEEPYSIAMTLLDQLPSINSMDVKILATDLSSQVVRIASRGVYKDDKVSGVAPENLRKYFKKGHGSAKGSYLVKDKVKRLISFRRLNLIDLFPFNGPFDLIFCRNVMIYFDKDIQQNLVGRFYNILRRQGYLFIGHSESLSLTNNDFHYTRPTIYRK
ncbi:MAG: protein-glutamate O-methyltransferase CheR [Deltaproteobacteria bacterium]|nr:protein-glutamate O-methyltransferase CheR [Deltaproteobacteria bacterium]